MTSTWRHSNGGPPKSPFRPQTQNDNDKTFQLNFADSEANKTFIPMTDVCVPRRFYSQPTSPSSVSRYSSTSLSSSYTSSRMSGTASGQGSPIKTVKHYDESLKSIKKENFNLKLKIFFLEERLSKGNKNTEVSLINENADLKAQLEGMKVDLNDKLNLLLEANDAIEILEKKANLQAEQHAIQIKELELKNKKNVKTPLKNTRLNRQKALVVPETCIDRSTESLVMEVLDELEEFSEREKDFENKYIKTITELKSESAKTEAELSKIRDKMLDYEEEIESLNANLDTKNEFISALQKEIQQKNNDSNCFLTQLDNSRSIIKRMEQELSTIRGALSKKNNLNQQPKQKKRVSNKNVSTELDNFDIIKHFEEQILFKNQELSECLASVRHRDQKIETLENIFFSQQQSVEDKQNGLNLKEKLWREKIEALTNHNENLNKQLKIEGYERKLLLRKIVELKEKVGQ